MNTKNTKFLAGINKNTELDPPVFFCVLQRPLNFLESYRKHNL